MDQPPSTGIRDHFAALTDPRSDHAKQQRFIGGLHDRMRNPARNGLETSARLWRACCKRAPWRCQDPHVSCCRALGRNGAARAKPAQAMAIAASR